MHICTTRMEINIRRNDKNVQSDMSTLGNFVAKNRIPAVVVDPEFIDVVLIERLRNNANFNIVSTVDFYDGNHFGLEKLRDLPDSIFKVDGFDILLSPRNNDKEIFNEMKVIQNFISKINPLIEIRWTLGTLNRNVDAVKKMLINVKSVPSKYIRTDNNVNHSLCSLQKHVENVALIKEHCGVPIKISGNVNYETMLKFGFINFRYDVTVGQARKIMAEADIYVKKYEDEIVNKKTNKQIESSGELQDLVNSDCEII